MGALREWIRQKDLHGEAEVEAGGGYNGLHGCATACQFDDKENEMGMIRIQMSGTFPEKDFQTCAEEGGHVCAIKRSIQFLTEQLGPAVVMDAQLTKEGENPPKSPLGIDAL